MCYRIIQKLAAREGWPKEWAYDGQKIMVMTQEMADNCVGDGGQQLVQLSQQEGTSGTGEGLQRSSAMYRVTIKDPKLVDVEAGLRHHELAGDLALSREVLQCLDVVLKQGVMDVPGCLPTARGLFFEDNAVPLEGSGGKQAWQGHTQALGLTSSGLVLTADAAVAPTTVERSVLMWMAERLGASSEEDLASRPLTGGEIEELRREIKATGMMVRIVHRTRGRQMYAVEDLYDMPADEDYFEDRDGQEVSVARYFQQKHRRPLQYPQLPCLVCGRERFPPELCRFTTEMRRRAVTDREVAQVAQIAVVPPDERERRIYRQILEIVRLQRQETLQAFGIEVEKKMLEVPARVLPRPVLQYGNGECVRPPRGEWRMDKLQYTRPFKLRSWAVLCLAPKDETRGLDTVLRELRDTMEQRGMQLPDNGALPNVTHEWMGHNGVREGVLQECMEDAAWRGAEEQFGETADLLLVVLPSKDHPLYPVVKRIGDMRMGLRTQCLVPERIGFGPRGLPSGRGSRISNLVLKINSRLGGTNVMLAGRDLSWCPPLLGDGLMLLGADVSHHGYGAPTPAAREARESIAAVVGTVDEACMRYAAVPVLQEPLVEIIASHLMRPAVSHLLRLHLRRRKALPGNIIMFRDGISGGQFAAARDEELAAIKQACRDVSTNYFPSIAYVVVTKRHNTRIFPLAGADVDPESGNVPQGTCVDRDACSAHHHDFYLVSHVGMRGTARPAHYHVLYDSIGLGPDALQLMTNWLCYTWARCNRPVSYCPPAYYAHRAAFHYRMLLASGDQDVHERMADAMYFV